MKCIGCGESKMDRATVEQTLDVGDGRTFVVELAGSKCAACGESLVDGLTLEAAEIRAAQLLAESGEPSGASFRFMRRAIGYPAKKLAAELDVAPETISRWENGTRPVDPATWLLLANIVTEGDDGPTARSLRNLAKHRSGEVPSAPKTARFKVPARKAS